MAETGGTSGLSTLALGGIGATVVVIGGAVMVWLGVFGDTETDRNAKARDPAGAEIAISPSNNDPSVVEGVSLQPDPSAEEPQAEAATAEQGENAQAEVVEVETDPSEPAQAEDSQAETSQAESVQADGVQAVQPTAVPATGSDVEQTAVAEGEGAGESETETAVASISEASDSVEGGSEATGETLANSESQDSETQPSLTEATLLAAPKLDLVRVDPTGETIIAGRAAEGIQVAILLDGEVLDHVDVQAGGEFVAFASIAPSTDARVISLRAEAGGQQTLSESSFILAPASPVPASQPGAELVETELAETELAETEQAETEQAATEEIAAATQEATSGSAVEQTAGGTQPPAAEQSQTSAVAAVAGEGADTETAAAVALANSPAGVSQEAPEAAAPVTAVAIPTANSAVDEVTDSTLPEGTSTATQEQEAVVAADPAPQPETTQIAVLRADAEGVTLVQPVAQMPQGKVVLDTISYSDSGVVQLAGRAGGNMRVLVYLDNAPSGQFATAENGSWGGGLTAVDPGVYTLRLDEVDAAGKVLSRLETPFKREAPEVLLPPQGAEGTPATPAPLVRAVTVQKGDTLWAISQQRYGSGFLYVRVFEANQKAIRDPDLIYPGQVFTIPE
ncbi:LysM peptidoglycan-binding domain-containing protein [Pseudophaeobacter sp.]|uniref:LysM peptidoglycan-binding domain-containing protein n=1 Tax=Pseudophaeobacter sp. TaxID=1971739 RepID=UPI004059349B